MPAFNSSEIEGLQALGPVNYELRLRTELQHTHRVGQHKNKLTQRHLQFLLAKAEKTNEADKTEFNAYKFISADVQKLHKQIKAVAAKNPSDAVIKDLENVLYNTDLFLHDKMKPEDYKEFANTIKEGKTSPALKIVGCVMLALCAVAIAFGIVVFALPVVATVLGVTGVIAASAAAGTATSTATASGVCFFSSRQKGVSQAVNNLHTHALKVRKDIKDIEDSEAEAPGL